MPWQRYVFDVGLEVLPDGRWAYPSMIVSVPRQVGKTTGYGLVMEQRAISQAQARCWFTMQTGKHAVDWLLNEHAPILRPLAEAFHLRRGAGFESVQWHATGGLVRPFPPQPDALHSRVTDLVVIDECWAFDLVRGHALDQAIVPTQATRRGRGQVMKLSTAGDAMSIWWQQQVEAGRAAVRSGRTEGLAYFEWSCPDDLDPCEPASWPQFHPAHGFTMDDAAMLAALDMLGPEEFARAFGNRWSAGTTQVIPSEAWLAVADSGQELPEPGQLVLGFDVAVDRSEGAILVAWSDEGICRLEVAECRFGDVAWMPGRLAELKERWNPRCISYDRAGPAIDVADAAQLGGLTLSPLGPRDYAAACAGFLDALTAEVPTLRYTPHPQLDAAAAAATRRALGDAWAWGRRQSTVSLATLTAATAARWGLLHSLPGGPFRIF